MAPWEGPSGRNSQSSTRTSFATKPRPRGGERIISIFKGEQWRVVSEHTGSLSPVETIEAHMIVLREQKVIGEAHLDLLTSGEQRKQRKTSDLTQQNPTTRGGERKISFFLFNRVQVPRSCGERGTISSRRKTPQVPSGKTRAHNLDTVSNKGML